MPSGGSARFTAWLLRHRVGVLVCATLLAILAGGRTVLTYADLRSDLEELLPESSPSVASLATLRERLPGVRYLGVVVDTGGPQNVAAANRFIDALGRRVADYPPEMVGAVQKDVATERRFAETYGLQLLEPADIVKLREAVERRRDWQVTRAMGQDLLDDEEEPAPELPVDELREKYQKRHGGQRAFPDDRFVAEDGRTVVLLVQASSHATGFGSDKQLLERVRTDIAGLGFPAAFAGEMRVGFAGDVATRVEEMEGLGADLGTSGVLVLLLVVLAIGLYFRSLRALWLLGVPLLYGTFYAFGIAALPPFSIRHLNSNTAFLGTIVVGNGINSGIILLARFTEERRLGRDTHQAITEAVANCWRPTLAAAAAAATAYGSLVITHFRGFNQFGWIGLFGMLACWAATIVLMPVLLSYWGERMTWRVVAHRGPTLGERLTRLVLGWPKVVLGTTLILSVLAAVGLSMRADNWMEHDFSKLRRSDSWESGERYWGARMDSTLGRYLTPTVVMSPDAAHRAKVEARLTELAREGRAGGLIESVRSVSTVLPESRKQAVLEAKRLAEVITPRLLSDLSAEERKLVEGALTKEALVPLEASQLPRVALAGLHENDGRVDRNVVIFPKLGQKTWDSAVIGEFTRDVRDAVTVDGVSADVAGSLLLSSDIATAMKSDGPRALLASLACVLVICVVAFRSFRLSVYAFGALFVGVLLMVGSLAWTPEKLNFSNFIALIISFGISADYAINMLKRYQAGGERKLEEALGATGGAVALCSVTTIIGFGSLLVAQNRALFSFGLFAVLGEVTCLFTCVVALPALLRLYPARGG